MRLRDGNGDVKVVYALVDIDGDCSIVELDNILHGLGAEAIKVAVCFGSVPDVRQTAIEEIEYLNFHFWFTKQFFRVRISSCHSKERNL